MRSRVFITACLALGACRSPDGGAPPVASSSASPVAAAPAEGDRVAAILAAEHRRAAGLVTEADQRARRVEVRRAAARALARIGGDAAQPGLVRALSDEDDEVIAWGAYGLGFWCKGHEKDHAAALVARAVSRLPPPAPAGRLDPTAAIARAVGRCGVEESEPTLVAWLAGPRELAVPAALALGDLASAKQKLREETLAALLNLAAGSASAPPLPEALYPIGRLEHVPETVVDRIREVAAARLATPGEARLFAVRALGRSGDPGSADRASGARDKAAAEQLARVVGAPGTFNAGERAEAARGLKRLRAAGQHALASSIASLLPRPDPVALTGLVGEDFGATLVAIEQLTEPGAARKALADLAALPPPPAAPPAVLRRVSMLRCAAASLLAHDDFHDKLLAACDVSGDGSPIGARAAVEVIGRGEIVGPRLAAYRERVNGGDLRAREAALELLETHEEIEDAAGLLTAALSAKESGLVGTAAEVIAKQPQRAVAAVAEAPRKPRKRRKKLIAAEGPPAPVSAAPSPALVKALLDVLARPATLDDPELADGVVDAVGALALKEARPRLEQLCASPYPTTRDHVQKALALVGGAKKTCDAPVEGGPPPAELDHAASATVTIALDTDAGPLTLALDPSLAPVVVTRVADLVRSGYYDGMVVHRVVPGFVAQFGAPFFDGFGGPAGKPAVRCETSPLPFAPLTVGVALSGRDTGSSQLFVMEGRYPHLDGQYALVGTATGPWSALAEGDVIRKAKLTP